MKTKTLDQLILEHRFFQGLSLSQCQLIAGCAKNVFFAEGTFIFKEGNQANTFYLLRRGNVALEIFAPQRGAILIQTLQEPDVLGFSAMFPPYRWNFDAHALSPVSALEFDAACLRRKCETDPALGYELSQRFGQIMLTRLQLTRVQVLNLYGHTDSR